MPLDLREAWQDLLQRRPTFRESLGVCGDLVEAWAQWTIERPRRLDWSEAQCRARWERGIPLLAEAPTAASPAEIEDLLGTVLELLTPLDESRAGAVQRLAEAWDRGGLGLVAFLPSKGRLGDGSAERESGLEPEFVGLAGCVALRPALENFFAGVRDYRTDDTWSLGVCPYCGAPPAFADIVEDGQRRLACHHCGGGWTFPRVKCPFCGEAEAKRLVRLDPGEREEGYAIAACQACRAYVKELDRRTRWNGGPPLVEDWGSPHFDLVARHQEYWRAVPVPVQLAQRA
jgi:FdhE protein